MKGAIIGDIAGSRFEFNNNKSKKFDLFTRDCSFTDDTITTVATMEWLMNPSSSYAVILRDWCHKYPHPMGGYGGRFAKWLFGEDLRPYGSLGNGSAMRVSPVGLYFNNLSECLKFAEDSASVTHNHPEGIKGAIAVAHAILTLRNGASKEEVAGMLRDIYNYDISGECDEIRKHYMFNETCQGTIPQAFVSFQESANFEDSIRTAVSLGGDSDTLACINGAFAEAHYGVPDQIWDLAKDFIPSKMLTIINQFYERLQPVQIL